MAAGAEVSQSLIYCHLTNGGSIDHAATRRTVERVGVKPEQIGLSLLPECCVSWDRHDES